MKVIALVALVGTKVALDPSCAALVLRVEQDLESRIGPVPSVGTGSEDFGCGRDTVGTLGFSMSPHPIDQQHHSEEQLVKVKACNASELDEGDAIQVPTDPPVAVFKVNGEFRATADMCTHDNSSLAEGWVEGTEVECSWHFARFCLLTGSALSLPAVTDLAVYEVTVEDGVVYVEVP